ncbi:MAG TPA: DUF47 family protein [Acidimicrobiia bacterium]|nr:DUF47 family protein [Acidimicrobiia bacterium]
MRLRFRLLPRDEGFYGLFDEAAANVADASRRMRDLVADYTDVEAKLQRLIECEGRGDELTDTILRRLDTSFVTPFDREDIHALTERLDDVVDDILAAADLLVLHKVDGILPEMVELAETLVKASEANVSLIEKLPRMKGIESELTAIDQLESEGDRIYRKSVARMFSGEYKAFEVLKWKDVVEAIENALNAIEATSDIVEGIVLKHA